MTDIHFKNAINGDRKSLEYFVNIVKDKIFNISFYYIGDFQLAQDCTQEILIKIISNIKQLNDAVKFENWSYSLASNYLRNYIRDSKKYQDISFEAMEMESRNHLEINYTENDLSNETNELVYELKVSCTIAMLMCLSKEDRILFLLSNLLGFNSVKVSEILNIKPEATRKRLSRANKKMKNFIDKNCGLLNKENSCVCKQRVNYAVLQKRLTVGELYFQNHEYLSDSEKLDDKIEKMHYLEDVGQIFKNNPNYTLKNSELNRIYEISEI